MRGDLRPQTRHPFSVTPKLESRYASPRFLAFAPGRPEQMLGCKLASVLCSEKRRGHRDVLDGAAWQFELRSNEVEVQVFASRDLCGPDGLPDAPAAIVVGEGELDDERQAARKCGVQVLAQVGGQDGQAVVFIELLKEIRDLDVGVTIVSVLNRRSLSEKRIALIEEQDCVPRSRLGEQLVHVFFGFAD